MDQRTKNVHSGQIGVRNMAGYIIMFDAAFCYIFSKALWEKYKASTKHEPAFISIRLYKLERPYNPVETILQDYLARRAHSCKKTSIFVHFVAGILQESCMHICKILASSGVAKPGPTQALARASAYLALASKTDKNHVIVC